MSRNTKQAILAKEIQDNLDNSLGKTEKNLAIYLELRRRIDQIDQEIKGLKKDKKSYDKKKVAELYKQRGEIKTELYPYRQKLLAAGIDLNAPDNEMKQQATIVDYMSAIACSVSALEGKGKLDPESRPKQKQAYCKKNVSGFHMTGEENKYWDEENLKYYGLPADAKQVQKMIRGITARQKKAQRNKKSYRCRDEAKKSLKAAQKVELGRYGDVVRDLYEEAIDIGIEKEANRMAYVERHEGVCGIA